MHNTKIFVNLPVQDLGKSTEFFSKLGFAINPDFTDENGACVVISNDIYAMILTTDYFERFTKKEIVDAKHATEALIGLSCESREQVDELVAKAVDAGGRIYREPDDYEWMYGHSFEDLDGHQWELLYMDMAKRPQE